jgi:hypothetical protein
MRAMIFCEITLKIREKSEIFGLGAKSKIRT